MDMETEIEAKFTSVDKEFLREQLQTAGATREYPETLMRRKNFDFVDRSLDRKGGWVRVRDEGDKVTLSYKQVNDRTLHGTKEISVIVDDFDKTCQLMEAIGLEVKAYQDTKREKWHLDDVEITIDTWPWIPSFVELESKSEGALRNVVLKLGFDWNAAMHGSVETVYQMHYDFSEDEINEWEKITFISEPDWLIARKK